MSPPPTTAATAPPSYENPGTAGAALGKEAMIAAMNHVTQTILRKPGYQTTECWFAVVSAVVPWLSAAVPAPVAAIITAAASAAYGISRAIAKISR